MRAAFRKEYDAVKAFTTRKVGMLTVDMFTRDAYTGMCPYINLVHLVQLEASEADVSFAAPLTYNGSVRAGVLVFNDMFTIYPYENQLYKLELSGREIKDYMEYAYNLWLAEPGGEHILRISPSPNPRTGSLRWSFDRRSYNFDSAAGLIYSVDVTKPYGERVRIESLAGGGAFDPDARYTVAMTSYRANGGGDILIEGAGIPKTEIAGRVVARYPEIRELVYRFILKNAILDEQNLNDRSVLGGWKFVPEGESADRLDEDMALLFGNN